MVSFYANFVEFRFYLFTHTCSFARFLQFVFAAVERFEDLGYRHFGGIVDVAQILRDISQMRRTLRRQTDSAVDHRNHIGGKLEYVDHIGQDLAQNHQVVTAAFWILQDLGKTAL